MNVLFLMMFSHRLVEWMDYSLFDIRRFNKRMKGGEQHGLLEIAICKANV